jgi:hypothetical protein
MDEINKPIFVVGSPRSGTSILTWCLGHHPNIFPVPESNWMGDFAVNVAVAHQIGSARGGLSILSAMDIRDDEFFAAFGRSVNELVVGHRRHLEINRENSDNPSKVNQRWLQATSMTAGPKTRWVDGTPEYSLHICGLRKLFPEARFIHVFRDVDAVVRSMVHFHRATGIQLVATEEEAYKYWLRTVGACLKAEQSYGSRVIYRLQYAALIDNPEAAIRSLLDFVGEPYSAKCLEPLAQRINSSNVPVDFKSEDSATDPKVVETARQLYAELQQTPQPADGSPAVADQLEAAFQEPYFKTARLQQELSEEIAKVEHYVAEVEQYKSQVASQEQHYAAEIEEYKTQLAKQEHHYAAEGEQYKIQLARQEQRYAAEIEEYKTQLAKQEHLYSAEVEQYKSQVASQERRYAAEIEEYKAQLGKQEHHYTDEVAEYKTQLGKQEHRYTAEVAEYKTQLGKQEHHYTAEVEQYKSQVASQERYYTGKIEVYTSQIAGLRKQLHDARKLSRLLDKVENAAARLANSRRWKLANAGAVIKAKLSGGKVSIGYDPLDKIVAAYSRWRASNPEVGKLDEEISALQSQAVPETSAIKPEKDSQSSNHPVNASSEGVLAPETSPISPPVP